MGFIWSPWISYIAPPRSSDFPPRGELVAEAKVEGTGVYPGGPKGVVRFYAVPGKRGGCVVTADIEGLPPFSPGDPFGKTPVQPVGPFGFHIHDMGDCSDAGMAAGGHFNPSGRPHGDHDGDLPVLFSNQGSAMMAVYTDRFTPRQIIGRTVMIHQNPDDFRTQPAGNSGARIACGVIRALPRRGLPR